MNYDKTSPLKCSKTRCLLTYFTTLARTRPKHLVGAYYRENKSSAKAFAQNKQITPRHKQISSNFKAINQTFKVSLATEKAPKNEKH